MDRISSAVTVLLAAYNGESFIEEQIQSILKQTYSEINIIIYDDCSSDNTLGILNAISSRNDHVRIVHGDINRGAINAFEILLSLVDTEYFCFSDQDDIWDEDKIELLMDRLKRDDLSLVYADMRVVDENLCTISASMWKYSCISPLNSKHPSPYVFRNPVPGCSLLCKKNVLQMALPFPKSIPMHDIWVVACAAKIGSIGYINKSLQSYRQHGRNELGAVSYSRKGFFTRVAKRGGSIYSYLGYRFKRREVILASLTSRFGYSVETTLLLFAIKSPAIFRVFLFPIYIATLYFYCSNLGLRQIIIEATLNIFPRKST